MKNANRKSEPVRNLDQVISKLSENDILNELGMSNVRGGEGDGLTPIIIIPKF